MGLDSLFHTPIIEITQDRYEKLIKSELKAKQYKYKLKEMSNFSTLIETIMVKDLIKIIESEEN